MHWIGIDFGTTNSIAAMREKGEFVETLDPRKTEPVPSLIAHFQGTNHFGFEAKSAVLNAADRSEIIAELKPRLGLADQLRIGGADFDVRRLAAEYLQHLIRKLFSNRVPKNLGVVVATPVEFPSSHRRALREALRSIDVAAVEFVYEPTAAVYAALEKQSFPDGPVGVLDWGGGTVDLSIVQCHRAPDRIQDLNVNARRNGLGGRDMDLAILRHVLSATPAALDWYDAQDRSVRSRILNRLELGKIEYLGKDRLKDHREFWTLDVPTELVSAFALTPAAIDAVLDETVAQVRSLAVQTTRTAGLGIEDVSHFLFVGGPLQSAAVREKLADLWPRAKELIVPHRQRATARGCALLAERGFQLTLAADIAVRQFDDQLHRVLAAGQAFALRDTNRYAESRYRLTDLTAPQAVLELGYVPARGGYEPLEVLSVPVVHERRPAERRVIPHDVRLRVALNELLYVTATATGRIQHADSDMLRDIPCERELSRVPLTLVPGTGRTSHA